MSKLPIYVFFHICCNNNWHSVVTKLYNQIKASGLYDKIDGIYCGVLGNPEQDNHPMFLDPKIKILFNENKDLFERFTLNSLIELSVKNDFYALYIHSKGIRFNGQNPCVEDWVDYMTYFNITQHEECLKRLEIFDAVGVNLWNHQGNLHFSGNFWWSKSSYIRNLNPKIGPEYIDPEFWIATSNSGKFSTLFNKPAYLNHYSGRFLPEEYVGKPFIYLNNVDNLDSL